MSGRQALIFQDLNPSSPKFSKNFDGKAHLNVLKAFDICLELPSDLIYYVIFVVDEISELVHTIKLLCSRHFGIFMV